LIRDTVSRTTFLFPHPVKSQLDRRIANKEVLKQEIAAWEKRRNELFCKVDWQFTTEDARIKLKRLYPSISS
jgi:hypothetical protein